MLQIIISAWEESLNASQIEWFEHIPVLSISWLPMSLYMICRYSSTLFWDGLQKLAKDPTVFILASVICFRRHYKAVSVEFSTSMKIYFTSCLLIETVFYWIICKHFIRHLIGISKTQTFKDKFRKSWCWNKALNLTLNIQLTTHYTFQSLKIT